jgi:hypothetical protein
MVESKTGRYIVTPKGEKTGVVLSIKEYNELLEDLADLAIIAERKDEPTQPFDRVKEKLERKWVNTDSK